MPSNTNKKVSVIIPTLDRAEVLSDLLNDLLKQNYPDFEVLIIDQTKEPPKEIVNFAQKYPQKIKYVHLLKKGSPHARNVGAQKASGEVLIFLDDDIRLKDNDFITHHLSNYTDPTVGATSGRIVEDFNASDPHRKEISKIKYFGLKIVPNYDATTKAQVDHAPGGNMSVKREIFLSVGGYREVYLGIAHLEETDFSLKITRAGYKIIFEPRAVIKHLLYKSGGNRAKDIYDQRYWKVRNHIVFILINYNFAVFVLAALQKFFWALFSGLKRWDLKMFKVMCKGISDGYQYFRSYPNL